MSGEVVKVEAIESALMLNDLSKLSAKERVIYYKRVCESIGLNPLTQPLDFINLNGKLRLYAKRDATEQLRKINGISITITKREKTDGLYLVTAQAKDSKGREDEAIGVTSIENLKGEVLANAIMKAESKAKRRATLSICGLGFLDESEIYSTDYQPEASVKTLEAIAEKQEAQSNTLSTEEMRTIITEVNQSNPEIVKWASEASDKQIIQGYQKLKDKGVIK